jgi:hypothetical protein
MLQEDVKDLTAIVETLAQFETTLAAHYCACAKVWLEDGEFWIQMEQSEIRHARNMTRIKTMLSERPNIFQRGRPFKIAAIQTSIAGAQWDIQRLNRKEMTRKNMLFIARDLEQSVLERNYAEILKSNDIEFQSLMKEMLSETIQHRKYLDEQIAKSAAKAEPSPAPNVPSLRSSTQSKKQDSSHKGP